MKIKILLMTIVQLLLIDRHILNYPQFCGTREFCGN